MFTALKAPIMAMAGFQISGDRVVEFMKIAITLRSACPNSIARNDANCRRRQTPTLLVRLYVDTRHHPLTAYVFGGIRAR